MAESMVGIKRSHRCTEVTTANIGQDVTVMGHLSTEITRSLVFHYF